MSKIMDEDFEKLARALPTFEELEELPLHSINQDRLDALLDKWLDMPDRFIPERTPSLLQRMKGRILSVFQSNKVDASDVFGIISSETDVNTLKTINRAVEQRIQFLENKGY